MSKSFEKTAETIKYNYDVSMPALKKCKELFERPEFQNLKKGLEHGELSRNSAIAIIGAVANDKVKPQVLSTDGKDNINKIPMGFHLCHGKVFYRWEELGATTSGSSAFIIHRDEEENHVAVYGNNFCGPEIFDFDDCTISLFLLKEPEKLPFNLRKWSLDSLAIRYNSELQRSSVLDISEGDVLKGIRLLRTVNLHPSPKQNRMIDRKRSEYYNKEVKKENFNF